MLHKHSVSILRALPCLQRHVLPSPAGPGRGGRLSCPWGRCSCTASCAMATLTAPVLTAYGPCAPASPHSSRKQGFLPPSCGDRDVTLWTREGLWNKRSEVSRALCLAPPKLSSMDNGYVIQPCLSKFTKQKKKTPKTSENVLINLIHSWLEEPQRSAEKIHRIFLLYTSKSSCSPSLVSLNLFLWFIVQQNAAKHKHVLLTLEIRISKCWNFHSPEELLNSITVVICDSVVKNEEKVFVNCWHNKINFPSLNFFSSLLWALMQCYWLALLKCQLAFLILNFSLNVISNCYCQTRECNLVFLRENPFLISSPVLPPFGQDGCLTQPVCSAAMRRGMH